MSTRFIVAAAVGVAVGFATGGTAGFQAFSLTYGLTGFLDPAAKVQGPRLNDLKMPSASYGTPIPYVEGHPRLAGIVAWSIDPKREVPHQSSQGGKGGPGVDSTTYSYEVDQLIILAENPGYRPRRCWSNGALVWSAADTSDADTLQASAETISWRELRVYLGADDQMPDPTYEAAVGVGNAPAMRGRSCIVLVGMNLGGSGQLPVLTWEIVKSDVPVDASSFSYEPLVVGQWGGIGPPVQIDGPTAYTSLADPRTEYTDLQAALDVVGGADRRTYFTFTTSQNFRLPSVFASGASLGPDPQYVYYYFAVQEPDVVIDDSSQGKPYPDSAGWCGPLRLNGVIPNDGKVYFTREGPAPGDSGTVLIQLLDGQRPNPPNFHNVNSCTNYPNYPTTGFPTARGSEVVFLRGERVPHPPGTALGYSIVTGTFRQLAGVVYSPSTGVLLQNGLGPVRAPGDAEYDDAAFWQAQRDAAIAAGTIDPSVVQNNYVQVDKVAQINVASLGPTALTEPDLRRVVERQCLRAGLNLADVDAIQVAGTPVRAMALSQLTSPRQALDTLAAAYLFESVESGGMVRFVRRGGASVAVIPFDDLGASESTPGEPLPRIRGNELELASQVSVKFANVDDNYQDGTETSARFATGSGMVSVAEVPLGLTPTEARRLADITVSDAYAGILRIGPWSSTRRWSHLDPTDVVLLTGRDGSIYRTRITKRTDANGIVTFEGIADDASVIDSHAVTSGGYTDTTQIALITGTELLLLDIPALSDADAQAPGFYAAGKPVKATGKWPGYGVYEQGADGTYARATTGTKATTGKTTAVLGPFDGGWVWDEANSVTVQVNGSIAGTTRAAILASPAANRALIGNEIIQFRDVTMVSAGTYRLSGLLRGCQGTEWAIGGHGVGERFVLLDAAVVRVVDDAAHLGVPASIKGVTAGQRVDSAAPQAFTDSGASLKPYAPAHLLAIETGNGRVLKWQRRSRIGGAWLPNVDVPLGETTEAYDVELTAPGGAQTSQRVTAREFVLSGRAALDFPADKFVEQAANGTYFAFNDDGGREFLAQSSRYSSAGEKLSGQYVGGQLIDTAGGHDDNVYVASYGGRFDPTIIRRANSGISYETNTGDLGGLFFDGTFLWATKPYSGTVVKLDAETLAETASYALPGKKFIHVNSGVIWAAGLGAFSGWDTASQSYVANVTGIEDGMAPLTRLLVNDQLIFIGQPAPYIDLGNYRAKLGESKLYVYKKSDMSLVATHNANCPRDRRGLAQLADGTVVVADAMNGQVLLLSGQTGAQTESFAVPHAYSISGVIGGEKIVVELRSDTVALAFAGQGLAVSEQISNYRVLSEAIGYPVYGPQRDFTGYTAAVYQISAAVGRGTPATLTL